MENAPESGPGKKPTPRANGASSGTARKAPVARKPAARRPAQKPKAEPVAAVPGDESVVEVQVESVAVITATEVEVASETEAASEPLVEATPEAGDGREAEAEETAPEPEPAASGSKPAVGWLRGIAARFAPARETAPGSDVVEAVPTAEVSAELFTVPKGGKKEPHDSGVALSISGLTKSFGDKVAVDHIDLEVMTGAFYGIVGPNGAGKTTTLSMITGLLRPDSGSIVVHGTDVWADSLGAKRSMGVLPDRLRLFDRLTGAQMLYYAGVLRGLDGEVVRARTADLATAFGLEDALGRLVSDYSAGMTKKIALAAAMIHSPRLLVLDEPFESVDPVSAATVTDILKKYVAAGGTVLLSSHSMDLVQRICDKVAVVVNGAILADGTVASVRDGQSLEERFVELAGSRSTVEGLEWLHSFSD